MSVCVDDGVGSGVKEEEIKQEKGINPFLLLYALVSDRVLKKGFKKKFRF